MNKCIIVDVDGTVALMNGKRTPFEWDKVHIDDPNEWVISLVRGYISANPGTELIFLSGRSSECYELTDKWLSNWFGDISYQLFMRPEEQLYEPDAKIKYGLYNEFIKPNYEVSFVIDDRRQVVEMWRRVAGLKVAQVAEGNF